MFVKEILIKCRAKHAKKRKEEIHTLRFFACFA